jgi:lipid II isoglutaminyl synthase (glutamine-hydrolysing)
MSNRQLPSTRYLLTIGWLYPDLMSTYGDRGNIICLTKRCVWRGISTKVIPISPGTTDKELRSIDLLFGGGAQDREQEIVMEDLRKKGHVIGSLIEHDLPALFVCGAPQLMGKYYEPAEGRRIQGLGIFDMVSVHPGKDAERLIGNVVAEILWENLPLDVIASETWRSPEGREGIASSEAPPARGAGRRNDKYIVGFENHGGRTRLGPQAKPFAKVIKGNGNNGVDGTEGVVYKNAIGSYFHGPLLPKNPHIADHLIRVALMRKYKKDVVLDPLEDSLEYQAQQVIAKRLGVEI